MAKVTPILLKESEEILLRELIKKGTDWRERNRAETILLLAAGENVQSVAEKQNLGRETIRVRRRKWLKKGLTSLPDGPRCGAPSKLSDEQRQQLCSWIDAEPLASRELLTRLADKYQVFIGRTTLRMELKEMGYTWKRTRYSLKKKRDQNRFEEAQVEINDLIKQAQTGEIELAYIDEAGFAPQPPNRSAWGKEGETHSVVPKRSKRLNLIGALLSSGQLMLAKLWQNVDGLWFFAFLMGLIEEIKKPLVVILDNASIHKTKELEPYWDLLKDKGMTFYFLPPYSPELNRIEILWKKMKYEWLPFKSFTPTELEQEIDKIAAGFGSEYKLTFC
jgi:transposase